MQQQHRAQHWEGYNFIDNGSSTGRSRCLSTLGHSGPLHVACCMLSDRASCMGGPASCLLCILLEPSLLTCLF